ncbi:MAG: DMT family transporter [Acidobacteria bacterium]|nr:DMT family transporter [Acidobacteriota bacterium]
MKLTWLAISLIVALIIPGQAAMNAKMREFVLNPMYSSMVSFSVGALSCVLLMFFTMWRGEEGNWRGAANAPWWAWCGGLVGMAFVTIALLAVPRLGAASFSSAILAGQLIGALALDHFGWLGLPQNQITPTRLSGALLLLAGIWLVQRD